MCEIRRYRIQKKIEVLEEKSSNKIKIIKLDLQNDDSVKKAANEIAGFTESVDILVNNAGTILTSSFLMTPIQKIKDLFQVNFFSQILFTQYIVKKMIKKKRVQ